MRLLLGWLMLWAFIDKLFGLGFNTCIDGKTGKFLGVMCKSAWLSGGSPTFGFLKFGTSGPLVAVFQGLAGSALVDWLFMLGLLLIGLAMMLGIGLRVAGLSGAVMMALMYLASAMPPAHNPLIDDHIFYLFTFLAFAFARPESSFSLGARWRETALVKRWPIFE